MQSTWTALANAWNPHARGGIDLKAGSALIVGCVGGVVGAIVCIQLYGVIERFLRCVWLCIVRVRIMPQCCLQIYIAPAAENMPTVRPKNRFAPRGRQPPADRATPWQYHQMRLALGTMVPEQSVHAMLQKHGDDTAAAVKEYFSPMRGM